MKTSKNYEIVAAASKSCKVQEFLQNHRREILSSHANFPSLVLAFFRVTVITTPPINSLIKHIELD